RPGSLKLPARHVLAHHPRLVEDWPPDAGTSPADTHAWQVRDIRYRRFGPVGWIDFDFYNGAMSTDHCRRLLAAFTWATQQDTRVIVLRGGDSVFSHGIHLNLIEASDEPTATAWSNIEALNDLCEAFITTTDQLLVAGVSGNAGAGGVMMALGADVV
nr:enoyl-CoA hydratase/isomerase family protein [Micromonospora sp. DSM 115978]